MVSIRRQFWPAVAVVVALSYLGCSSGPAEDPLAGEWTALQEAKTTLDGKRQELAQMRVEAATPAEEEAATEGGEAAAEGAEPVDLTGDIDALQQEIVVLSEDLATRVVAFLNNDPIIADVGPTERQLAAIRIKSSEDMVVAQEWIDEGGDYRQAIQIYQNTLQLDPDNPELKAALADAEEKRFMSEERFAAAKKGMTEEDVRAVLGTPIHYNIKSYEDKGVTAWFYPSSEDGAAAAVWFRPDKEGVAISYLVKYAAIPGKTES